jgi:hypothetical protein
MSDDRELVRPAVEPIRFEASVGGRHRAPAIVAAITIGFIGLALAKPWAAAPAPQSGTAPTRAASGPVASPRAAGPAAASGPSASVAAVQKLCLDPGSWRTATIEQWAPDQTVRVWRAIEPRTATGPTDPGIDVVPAVGETVPAIGYCAPAMGPDSPGGPADVAAWRVAGDVATPIDLRQVAPVGVVSEFGALFGPPDAREASWPSGRYVFRFAEVASNVEARWFAVAVRSATAPLAPFLPATPTSEVMQPGGGMGAFFLP